MTDEVLTLADGRQLTYRVDGPEDGPPVLYLHGSPGSRLDGDPWGRTFGARRVRFDRPGFGGSDRHEDRTLATWTDDVVALVDHLGIDRLAVIGVSGGGPHALAAAWRLGDRVTRVGVVSGLGPLDHDDWADGFGEALVQVHQLARTDPSAIAAFYDVAGQMLAGAADDVVEQFVAGMPEVDRAVMADPAVRAAAIGGLAEALRPGGAGVADELAMLHRPWGFALGEVTPEVLLWQGTEDVNVPPSHAERMAAELPNATLTVLEGQGHVAPAMLHLDEVFAAVLA